jgi:xylose isomerase
VRAYAIQKTLQGIDLGAEFGAKVYVFWGGREGVESDATKNPVDAIKRYREAIDFACEYIKDKKYGMRVALEPKPNEPRSDMYLATVGAMLGFIATLANPEMVGVNPEVAHEHMAGLNFLHAIAQAWEAGKLFHIDLNDQKFGRYDQDFRFGADMLKQAFFIVKFLEDVKYDGSRHFDAHAYRTEDAQGVKEFAAGCMRTYLILREKARQFNQDSEIQAILADLASGGEGYQWLTGGYSSEKASRLLNEPFDRGTLGGRGLNYEKLDQLTNEILLGVR